MKSEAEQSLPDRTGKKGKSVQKPATKMPEEDDEGAETETESSAKAKSEAGDRDRAATVEDVGEDGENGSKQT
jgi:hypothetical protein